MARNPDDGGWLVMNSAGVTDYPLTIAAWFNQRISGFNDFVTIIESGSTNNNRHGLICTNSNQLRASSRDTAARNATAGNLFSTGQWHHGCAVFETSTLRRAILDGDLANAGQNTQVSNPVNISQTIVGAREAGGTSRAFAQIAEAVIWNVVLTDDEIVAHSKGLPTTEIRPESIVFHANLLRDEDYDIASGQNLVVTGGVIGITDHPSPIQYYEGFHWEQVLAAAPPTIVPKAMHHYRRRRVG